MKISKHKFIFIDPDLHYVHHMSMYEHENHEKYGFVVAENKSEIMADSSMIGECQHASNGSENRRHVAAIPFYGGKPPNTTSELKVLSQGQGNSLVSFTSV